MLNRILILLIGTLTLQTGLLFAAEKAEADLDYVLHLPSGKLPVPCVIICSGQGYHKDRPLLKEFAQLAKKNGFAAIRFDWSFFTAGATPSEDGSKELQDIEQIITLVKHNPKIDSTRIYITGKSMGSLLAWSAFREHKELKGCILLTPILSKAEEGNSYYPDLAEETRPVAFILGDRDGLCKLQELYKYAGSCALDIPIIVLPGGHGIQIEDNAGKPASKKVNARALRLAIESAVNSLQVMEYDSKQ